MDNKQQGMPKEQAKSSSLESLEQSSGNSGTGSFKSSKKSNSNFNILQNRPTRPWKKQAIMFAILLIVVGGLAAAAYRLNNKIKNTANNQQTAESFKQIENPVLGSESLIPVQSLNDQTVTINGDLTVNGKLKLTPQAIVDLANLVGNKVALNPTLGDPAQAGNINITGGVVASNFQGNGVNLGNLNADNITSGTLNSERLDSSVTRLGQTIPLSALQSTVLSSLNGLGGNSNVNIVGSGSLVVSTDPLTNNITLSSTALGDISSVTAGLGLTGGGASDDVTLSVDTGVVTIQGNTFNGNNQLVRLNGAGELPVLSATNLTNLNANNIVTGALGDSFLSANVTLQGNTFNLPNKLLKLDGSGNIPALNGANLTNLNSNNITSGNLSDARLSSNVALLGANQTFTGNVVFSQPLTANSIQASAAMVVGSTNQSLTLQGDLTTNLKAVSGAGSVKLGFTGTPTGVVNYNLDASAPAGTYTLCTTVGNCTGAGDGVTTLGGTTNKIAKYTGGQSIGDSSITDDSNLVTISANGLYKAGSDSTTAFLVQNAAGSTNVFTVDTNATRVAIGQSTADYTLDVAGDINSDSGIRVGGNLVCDATGCAASGESGFYIQNGTSLQTAANFNIESANTTSPTIVLKAKTSQTADLLQARDSSNNVISKIDASGNVSTSGQYQVNGSQISSVNLSNDANLAKLNGAQTFSAANLFRNATDSTSAFSIQNATASNLFVADTSSSRIAIGQASAGYTLDINGDVNITSGSSYRINGVAICGPTATCAPSSGSGSYVQNGLVSQTANFNIQSISSNSIVGILQGAVGQSADIFQARDSSNNVLAKITSSGAIYQGANQVCDASNNCNYALGSGSGNYIQNTTSTQTANMNIKSASTSQVTAVIQGANAQTADILQVKDGTSQGNSILSVNQSTPNLITNSSFDTSLSGLTARLSTSTSVSTAEQYIGAGSAQLVVAVNGDGANFAYPIASSTAYSFSFYLKASAAVSMQFGRSDDGSAETSCSTITATTSWQRYSCSFTTGTTSGSPFVYIRTTAGSSRTLYLDAVQLEAGSTTTAYQLGKINLNGVITSPTTFRNQTDSTTALQVQNAAGTSLLNLDTVNMKAVLNTGLQKNGLQVGASYGYYITMGGTNSVGIFDRNSAYNTGYLGSAGGAIQSDSNFAVQAIQSGYTALAVSGTTTQTADLLQVQSGLNNSSVLSVSQNNSNLITNPSFDTVTTGWAANGSSTLTRTTSDQYSGAGSMSVATTAAANDGAKFNYNLLASTTYSFSVYARATGSNFSTLQLGYSPDGTAQTSCATAQAVVITGWTRYTCTFTTTTVSGTRFVYIKQTDATARTFYVDAVQLEAAAAPTNYNLGNISLNGTVISPTVFQNQSNSTTALQIQNAAGVNQFTFDTVNNSFTNYSGLNTAKISNATVGAYGAAGYGTQLNSTGVTGDFGIQLKSNNASATALSFVNQNNTPLLNIDTTNITNNLITNPSFDSFTTGWAANGSSTLTRTTADQYSVAGALSVATTAAASDGAKYNYNLLASTQYSFSVYARATGSSFGTLQLGYSPDGTTQTSCLTAQTVVTTGWIRYTCTFTTSSVSGTRFVYVKQTDATARTFYIDATQLEAGSTATNYNLSNITLNGTLTSPTIFQNQTNSTSAFQVQNAAGGTLFNIDSVSGNSSFSNTLSAGGVTINYANGGTIRVGNSYYASNGWSGSTAQTQFSIVPQVYTGTSGSNSGLLFQQAFNPSSGNAKYVGVDINPTINQIGSATGDYTALQIRPTVTAATGTNRLLIDAGTTATPGQMTLSDSGQFKLKNATDSTSAFQIQNAAGTSNLFIADTTNTRLAVAQATANYTLDVAGDINSTTALRVGGNQVCDSTGCIASDGQAINNDTVTQSANINIQSTDPGAVTAVIQGADSQTADILQIRDGSINDNLVLSVGNNGGVVFQNASDSTDAVTVKNYNGDSIFQVDTGNGRVGIANETPGNLLSVGALEMADPSAQLAVSTGDASNSGIVVQGVSGQTGDLLQAQDSTGSVLASIDFEGSLTVKSITFSGHIKSVGPTPTIEATTNGVAGTDPTVAIIGTDAAGRVGLYAGSSPTGNGDFIRVIFDTPYVAPTSLVITPQSPAAADLARDNGVYALADLDEFRIYITSGTLSASENYEWSYSIVELPDL